MITLETLKTHEANILAQLNHVQGALAYNRQLQQEAVAQMSPSAMSDNGEVPSINRIPATTDA